MHVVECSRPFWNVRVMYWGSCAGAVFSADHGQLRHDVGSGLGLVMVPTAPAMFSGEVDLRMHNALQIVLAWLRLVIASAVDSYHVACQSIVAGKGLLLNAQCTTDLLLASIVNRVLVSGKVVRT